MRVFLNRKDGGRELASHLLRLGSDAVVYGLPRGGMVTAKVVAEALAAPLDMIVARKIGHPRNPEFAIGAITDEGDFVIDKEDASNVSPEWLEGEKEKQLQEAIRRRITYLGNRLGVSAKGRSAILVDDGIATGYTMEAAILSVQKRQPSKVIAATPVAHESVLRRFVSLADEVVVAQLPANLSAIGAWYTDFSAVEDAEVIALMDGARAISRETESPGLGL